MIVWFVKLLNVFECEIFKFLDVVGQSSFDVFHSAFYVDFIVEHEPVETFINDFLNLLYLLICKLIIHMMAFFVERSRIFDRI